MKKFKVVYAVVTMSFILSIILMIRKYYIFYEDSESLKILSTSYAEIKKGGNVLNSLKNKYNNDDIIAIISIDNTDLEEVVVQTDNNSYYLNHLINKEKSKNGSIFMDYRNNINSKQINIYGHNSSYIDLPFKKLLNYINKSYYPRHEYIRLRNDNQENIYKIFSVIVTSNDYEHELMNFNSDEEWNNHFQLLKDLSLYDTGVKIDEKDEIIVLQTCMQGEYKGNLLIISARKENKN